LAVSSILSTVHNIAEKNNYMTIIRIFFIGPVADDSSTQNGFNVSLKHQFPAVTDNHM